MTICPKEGNVFPMLQRRTRAPRKGRVSAPSLALVFGLIALLTTASSTASAARGGSPVLQWKGERSEPPVETATSPSPSPYGVGDRYSLTGSPYQIASGHFNNDP